MDKQRADFEEWVMSISSGCADLSLDIHGIYDSWDVERYWEAWQASRAAIVVELPERMTEIVADTLIHGRVMANDMHTKCSNAIRAAGLSIKGE